LLQFFGTPEAVWQASEAEWKHLQKRGFRWIDKVCRAKNVQPEETVHRNREKGIQFISHESASYPQRLLTIADRPYGLFYRGSLPEEGQKAIAVVGARMCTRTGKEHAEQIGTKIAQAGGLVISGAAYGIDGAAQWAALAAGGASFAVLGCGVDIGYPSGNAQLFERLVREGGLLSEFPPGTPPAQRHFPMRNRIISGLSDLVLVIEARRRSGSLITAEFAAEQGRTVVAVPGRPEDELSEGCNELIAQGADVFLSAESFLLSVFPENKAGKKKMSDALLLAPTEKLVYSSLGLHSKSLWELEACTALSLAELSQCLLSLEIKGLVKETERGYYARME
jgi:DNA processing protein